MPPVPSRALVLNIRSWPSKDRDGVAAIKEMVIPSLLPVLSPIVLYMVIYYVAGGGAVGKGAAFSAVGAMKLFGYQVPPFAAGARYAASG